MTPVPIWVALGVGNRPSVTFLDATSGEDPQCWRGNDLEFHCAVFDANGAIVNLNNAAQVAANLYAAPDSSLSPLMPPVELDSTDIEPTIDIDDWKARADQQFTIAIPASSTMQEMTSRHVGKFWLTIKILTEDGSAITTGGGWLRIFDDGTQSGTVPPVPPSEYYTKTQIDALFATTVQDPTQEVGDIIMRGLDGLERLPVGDEDQLLEVHLGKPAWVTKTVSGDVTGPSGATADHFASFSGPTGKIIKDSGVGASSFETPAGADAKVSAHNSSSIAHDDIRQLVSDAEDAIGVVAGDLSSHESNTNNPHSVTKNQVGLGFVDNTTDMQKPVSTAQALALAGKASLTDFNNHVGDHFNPHKVTKAQVGLGNADNTSDADKPISDATQDALDAVYISASNPANITQDSAHRFVSDTEKSTWNGKESGGAAAAAIVAHVGAADPHGDRADAAAKYQPLVAGKGLSTNDYTTDEKSKLAGIASGATANTASTVNPLMSGMAAPGTAAPYAREDHVHPIDTSREPAIAAGTAAQYYAGNKAWRDLATDVRAALLTGYAIATPSPIAATDTVLQGVGKLEGDIAYHTEHNIDAAPGDNYHYSDGSTSGRCNYCIPGMALAGKPLSLLCRLPALASNPSGVIYLVTISSASANTSTSATLIQMNASGSLTIISRIDVSNYRARTILGFRAAWMTSARNLLVTLTPDATDPVVLVQNNAGGYTQLTLTNSDAGTPPSTWMNPELVSTYINAGLSWPAGPMPTVRPIVGTFTPTDFTEFLTRGRVPMWASLPGNAASFYTSNFSAGVDSCVAARATLTGNVDGVSDGTTSKDDCLQVTMDSTAASSHYAAILTPSISAARTLQPNTKVRVTGEYLIDNANTVAAQLRVVGFSTTLAGQTINSALTTKGTWATFDVQVITNGSLLFYFYTGSTDTIDGNGTDKFYLKNIIVTKLGTISALKPQRCLYSADVCGNDIGWTSTAGISPVVMNDGREYAIAARTNTSGNQKLTGAAIWAALAGTISTVVQDPLYFGSQVIDKLDVWSDAGGETVTVGSASGGSQYVTSATLSAGLNRLTLVTGIPAGTDIWIGSNSTNTLYWRIRCYKSAARGT